MLCAELRYSYPRSPVGVRSTLTNGSCAVHAQAATWTLPTCSCCAVHITRGSTTTLSLLPRWACDPTPRGTLTHMTALIALFDADPEVADLFFILAAIILWFVGVVTLVQGLRASPPAWAQGLAWIATGCIPFGLMFLTT